MSCPSDEDQPAPSPPRVTTITKTDSNDGACSDAEETEAKFDPFVVRKNQRVQGQEAQLKWLPQVHCCQAVGHRTGCFEDVDIKHEFFTLTWFQFDAVRRIESGWVVQFNGDAIFGFCHTAIDMIALSFCFISLRRCQ